MKSDTIVMRLARGAVASSIAGACLVPQGHSADAEAPKVGGIATVSNEASLPEQTSHEEAGGTVVFTFAQSPKEWTKAMENEFRRLALEEAKGKLTEEQAMRLEELSAWRDRLEHPRPAEEISLQLKRDRLLEKVAEALKDYVEFQEGAGKKRAATRLTHQTPPLPGRAAGVAPGFPKPLRLFHAAPRASRSDGSGPL